MANLRSPTIVFLSPRDGRSSEVSGGSEPADATEVASKTDSGLNGLTTEDGRFLSLLLSFFSPSCKITHDFLLRGGSPRKRWTPDGGNEEVDASTTNLSPELTRLLSDPARLSHALSVLSTNVLKDVDHSYILNTEEVTRIRQDLATEALNFWKTQALIVSYRAFPWQYIEPRSVFTT